MDSHPADLRPHETDLVGQWLDIGSRIVGDAVEDRIAWLTRERLERVGTAGAGWDTLYRDPRDGRFWELTYPWGEAHGGGPRRLRALSEADARARYRVVSA